MELKIKPLNEIILDVVHIALIKTRGKKGEAAKLLGINRNTLGKYAKELKRQHRRIPFQVRSNYSKVAQKTVVS